MTPDHELKDRFRRAAEGLPSGAGHVDDVIARGRRRAHRRRVAGFATGVVVAIVGVGTAVQLVAGPRPFPVGDLGPAGSPPATEGPSPTSAPSPASTDAAVVERPQVELAHSRYGMDGVVRHTADGTVDRVLHEGPARRVIGTPAGGVVLQEEMGTAILHVSGDGVARTLAPPARGQRLLTLSGDQVWFTARTGADRTSEEDVERLLSVTLSGDDAVVGHGVSAGVEGFTDELTVDADGSAAWLACHLQCALTVGHVTAVTDGGEMAGTVLMDGWLTGLARSPDGAGVAVVEGGDPNLPEDDVALRVFDAGTGEELAAVPLPRPIAYDSVRIEFLPDGRSVTVADAAGAFVVRELDAADPTVEPLPGDAGITLHVTGTG